MKIHKGNPKLKNHYPENYIGNPLTPDERFMNLNHHFIPGFREVIKWKREGNPDANKKKNDLWRPEVIYGSEYFHERNDCIVWLGHASFYLHLNKKKILIDPVFGNVSLLKRLTPFPTPIADFRDIDYLLVSHAHRDHCDAPSLKKIAKQNQRIKVLSGLNMEEVLKNWFDVKNIQTAGWYQEYSLDYKDLKIFYVPSRHWSKRWLNDDNKTLWGGFIIQFKEKTIYFMGDSGYGEHFGQIASVFPKPDYCLMGIGAYKPEWFMGPSHLSPTNSVRAFNEMGGKNFIPMHYATFDLSDEPISDPINMIKELDKQKELSGKLIILKPGEKILL
ncbi:MAG: MBL fold metallo-hydrolase [Bacteroidota bacterium]|jgi:L-ascorbate metabolism protein UlaG (beta-lactamase superfamily)